MSKQFIYASLVALSLTLPMTAFAKQDGVAAVVNDSIILQSELADTTNALLQDYAARGQTISQALAERQALELLILRKLQLGIVKRAGVNVNDELIDNQLLQIAKAQGFNSLAEFQQSLERQQLGSYNALRQELIDEAAVGALMEHQLTNLVKISPQEIEAFLRSPEGQALNQVQYRTVHIRVPIDATTSQAQALAVGQRVRQALAAGQDLETVMAQAGQDYPLDLQGADTGYHPAANLPADLAPIITSLPVGGISPPLVGAQGVDVILLLDKRDDGQVLLPEWQASHILVKVDANQSAALAEQRINELYNALLQGANFGELAATYSDDTGSAAKQGSLGWVSEGQMVPAFEVAMKNTSAGDFSRPFVSQFGYHIVKVDATRQRDVTEQYKRALAEEILFKRQAPQAQEDWLQELKSSAYINIMPK